MTSPFQFFRKHQAGMMVVLVILAMMVFTLDALFTAQGANFWLLGLLLGGAVFGTAGVSSGQWLQWGIGGALLGTLLGWILPEFTRPPGVALAKFGVIEREDLDQLYQERAVGNGFMARATEEAFGQGAARFAHQFSFNQSSPEQDVLFARVMSEEANQLGITVSDEMVRDFINERTGQKLSREGFSKARQALQMNGGQVSAEQLFDILREHIRREIAYRALVPVSSVSPPPPEVQWDYFCRMNVRQALNVARLDVDAFLDQVEEPSDAEIEQLFATAGKRLPNTPEAGDAGFFQPGKALIAWLELDYSSVENDITPVTDEDIQAFYDANRETRYRRVVLPDQSEGDTTTADEESAEEETDKEAASESSDSEDAPQADKQQEPESEPAKEPAAEEKSEPAKEESETPAAEEKPAENSSEEPAEETPADSDSEPADAPTEEPASEEKASDAQLSVDDPEASEEPTAEETTEDAAPAPLVIPQVPETPEADAASEPEPVQYEYVVLNDELKDSIREELEAQRVRELVSSRMDAALAEMQAIASARNSRSAEISEKDAARYLEDPDAAAADLRVALAELTPEYLKRMEDYAAKNGLKFATTEKPVDYSDFSDAEQYPLGAGVDPTRQLFQVGQADRAAYELFSAFGADAAVNDTQLFYARQAEYNPTSEEEGSPKRYAYWAVEFVEAHEPRLDEDGVRDEVILALKRQKARELVQTRGEELAQQVREGLAKEGEERVSMAASLESATVTGKEGSAALAVQSTQPFPWIRTQQTPAMNFQSRPQAELSPIRLADGESFLEDVGNEFMQQIFQDLQDGEVGIVPNGDRSAWYIVQIVNRFPSAEFGMDQLRERFASAGQIRFANSPVMQVMNSNVLRPAVASWQKGLWRKYEVQSAELPPMQ